MRALKALAQRDMPDVDPESDPPGAVKTMDAAAKVARPLPRYGAPMRCLVTAGLDENE
jgi:hypothetical protein